MKSRQKSKAEPTVSEEEMVMEDLPYNELDKLQSLGINAADITKLKAAGLCTCISVLMAPRKELCSIKGITDVKADRLIEAAQKIEGGGFATGIEIRERRKRVKRLTTGCKSFDALLGGGVESMCITEAFGEFRTGKTQLSHTLAVTAQLPLAMGGGQGKVAYIDTENTFRPERIAAIAGRFQLDPDAVLNNIICAKSHNVDHMKSLLTECAAAMLEDTFALLIVDSIIAPFRVDFSGRGELAERQQLLGKVLNRLQKISEQFNVAVFITNQVMSDPGGAMSYMADPRKPVGGNILAHASATRLYLKKGKGENRICRLYDSPSMPEADCTYMLSDGGIADPIE